MNLNYSVVIPVRNAALYLPALIPSLLSQKGCDEIIFVDSSSSDDTVSIIKSYPQTTLLQIKKEEFRHGRTRDMALRLTRSEFVVFLTQDALPVSSDSLALLVSSFEDESVGLAYGRQLPHKDAKPFGAHARIFNYPPKSRLKTYADKSELGIKTPFCSNSFAAYRKSAYFAVGGFDHSLLHSEDMHTAAKMLKSGFSIYYNADSCVYHSHDYTLKEEFLRYKEIGYFHALHPWIREEFGSASGEGVRFVISELNYLLKNAPHLIPMAFLRNFLKWLSFNS